MEIKRECIIVTPIKTIRVEFTYEEFNSFRESHPEAIITPTWKLK